MKSTADLLLIAPHSFATVRLALGLPYMGDLLHVVSVGADIRGDVLLSLEDLPSAVQTDAYSQSLHHQQHPETGKGERLLTRFTS